MPVHILDQRLWESLYYASTVWKHTCRSNRTHFQGQQNLFFKYSVDAPWYGRNRAIFNYLQHTAVTTKLTERARAAKSITTRTRWCELRSQIHRPLKVVEEPIRRYDNLVQTTTKTEHEGYVSIFLHKKKDKKKHTKEVTQPLPQ